MLFFKPLGTDRHRSVVASDDWGADDWGDAKSTPAAKPAGALDREAMKAKQACPRGKQPRRRPICARVSLAVPLLATSYHNSDLFNVPVTRRRGGERGRRGRRSSRQNEKRRKLERYEYSHKAVTDCICAPSRV
jgi:hypothetical protein